VSSTSLPTALITPAILSTCVFQEMPKTLGKQNNLYNRPCLICINSRESTAYDSALAGCVECDASNDVFAGAFEEPRNRAWPSLSFWEFP
jgi:hypothetical protein